MILSISRESLIESGSRLRAGNLLQQSGYTLALGKQVGPELEAILPQGFLGEVEEVRREVEAGLRNRTNLGAEARDATREQNATLRRVREWRRKMAALGRMASRLGIEVPEPLTTIGRSGAGVPTALRSLQEAVGLLKQQAKAFERFPLYDAVLGEGESLAAALAAVDATQESKRLSELPEAVRSWYAAKGTLYTALKAINDAGRALFAGDVPAASRFNLAILYRMPSRVAAVTVPAQATPGA